MRTFISIALVCILSWQLAAKVTIYAYWKADQVYITNTLCENRSNPASGCQGSCYLKKQLKKTEAPTHSSEFPLNLVQKLELAPFILTSDLSKITQLAPGNYNSKIRVQNQAQVSQLFQFDIFHPPQAIL